MTTAAASSGEMVFNVAPRNEEAMGAMIASASYDEEAACVVDCSSAVEKHKAAAVKANVRSTCEQRILLLFGVGGEGKERD